MADENTYDLVQNFKEGVRVKTSVANISNGAVPTDAELVAAFGAAPAAGENAKVFVLNDAGGTTNAQVVVGVSATYFFANLTKAT